jgi:hypothetical protein
MGILLFALSLTVCIHFFIKIIGIFARCSIDFPIPILHLFGVSFGNTYISTPAILYQVYFWSKYFDALLS